MNRKIVSLESQSLIIRQAQLSDAGLIADYFIRNRLFHKPFDPIRPEEFYTERYWQHAIPYDLENFQNDKSLRLFLFDKSDVTTAIGMIHFSGFIRGVFQASYVGYSLDEHAQGKGYMNQALRESVKYMFEELHFHRIMANCMTTNIRSLNLLKKLDFQIEGTAKDYLYIDGRWEDHILTACTNKNYKFNQ